MTPEEPQTPQPRRMPGPKNPQEAEEWARHIMAAHSQEDGAAASGNQQSGGAVQKVTGVGGVPGNDAGTAASREELAKVRAELDAKKEKEEAARGGATQPSTGVYYSGRRSKTLRAILARTFVSLSESIYPSSSIQ